MMGLRSEVLDGSLNEDMLTKQLLKWHGGFGVHGAGPETAAHAAPAQRQTQFAELGPTSHYFFL